MADTRTQAYEAVLKVREAGCCTGREIGALERCIDAFHETPRKAGWQQCVDAWFAAYERAIGAKLPKPTNTEFNMLMQAVKRIGEPARACVLIDAFFAWRETEQPRDWGVGSTPREFMKHLPRIVEFEAKHASKKQAERAKAAERQQRHSERNGQRFVAPPSAARELIRDLAKGKGANV